MQEKKIKFINSEIYYKNFEKKTISSQNSLKSKSEIKNILILHWWWWTSNSWIKFSKILSEKWYNVIVPDLPWFWKTEIHKVFDLNNYAEIIEHFVKELDLKNFILWWHSNGWAISIKLINRWIIKPELLVLNNSAWIRKDKKRNLKRKFFKKLSNTIKVLPFIKNSKMIFLRKIFYKIIGARDYLEAEKNPFLKQTYLNMISSDLKEEIKKISIKTFLIWWEKDTYTPLSDWIFMKDNIKKSDFIMLKNETHWIHLKNPELLSETFLKLIK